MPGGIAPAAKHIDEHKLKSDEGNHVIAENIRASGVIEPTGARVMRLGLHHTTVSRVLQEDTSLRSPRSRRLLGVRLNRLRTG